MDYNLYSVAKRRADDIVLYTSSSAKADFVKENIKFYLSKSLEDFSVCTYDNMDEEDVRAMFACLDDIEDLERKPMAESAYELSIIDYWRALVALNNEKICVLINKAKGIAVIVDDDFEIDDITAVVTKAKKSISRADAIRKSELLSYYRKQTKVMEDNSIDLLEGLM